ncbi:MAG: hypothetical protein R2798_06215 [Chitinophagales bacterium]
MKKELVFKKADKVFYFFTLPLVFFLFCYLALLAVGILGFQK